MYVHRICVQVLSSFFRQESYKEKQKLAFIAQIKIAVEHNLPIVIHCRDAELDCWDIMEEVIIFSIIWFSILATRCFSSSSVMFENVSLSITYAVHKNW